MVCYSHAQYFLSSICDARRVVQAQEAQWSLLNRRMSLDTLVPGAKPEHAAVLCPCLTIKQARGNIAVQWAGVV